LYTKRWRERRPTYYQTYLVEISLDNAFISLFKSSQLNAHNGNAMTP
jgi:hypothetical protein